MKKQHYYLKFLEKEIKEFTYIENDGFYCYNVCNDMVGHVEIQSIVNILANQFVDFDIDPENLFKPSNYLVSPFNKVEQFISGEYFLTTDQAKKKKYWNRSTKMSIYFLVFPPMQIQEKLC